MKKEIFNEKLNLQIELTRQRLMGEIKDIEWMAKDIEKGLKNSKNVDKFYFNRLGKYRLGEFQYSINSAGVEISKLCTLLDVKKPLEKVE